MKIKQGYIDKRNESYDIRNINFENQKDFYQNSGNFICQSTHNDGIWCDTDFDLENGVYLYAPKYDKNKALRVYKNTLGVCEDYKYTAYSDYKMVSELLSRQKNVKMTEFPTGIVTIENYVIGQEIPFYQNSKNLSEIIHLKKQKNIIEYYIYIINILEELNNNGIVYSDIHAKNFIINASDKMLKLIDFDTNFISFDNQQQYIYMNMIVNLKNMINHVNKEINVNFELNEEETLEGIKKEILIKSKNYM